MKPIVINVSFPKMSMATARVIAGGGSFALAVMVFVMMAVNPELAKDDLFKMLAQAVVIQGLVGLVMAFLFTGEQRETIHASPPDASAAADAVAGAAQREADAITGEEPKP
jgi:hypothetical protein